MDLKEAHHAHCHHIVIIIPLCTRLKESTVTAWASHLCFIDEYCMKEEFSAEDTKQFDIDSNGCFILQWMVFSILDGLMNMCAFCL